jgi:hypothetical protein
MRHHMNKAATLIILPTSQQPSIAMKLPRGDFLYEGEGISEGLRENPKHRRKVDICDAVWEWVRTIE